MNDKIIAWLVLSAFLGYGFYRNRKYMIEWFKDWRDQMKIAWKGGRK